MDTKKIIHMVQGNTGKRKEINTNMMDISIKISKNITRKNQVIIIIKIVIS